MNELIEALRKALVLADEIDILLDTADEESQASESATAISDLLDALYADLSRAESGDL